MERSSRLRVKWTLWLLVAVIGVSWIGMPVWGNPWVRLTLKGRVLGYLAEQYPQERFAYAESTYDFLNHRYVAVMVSAAQPDLEFRVSSGTGADWQDDYLRNKREHDLRSQAEPVVQAAMPEARVSATALGDGPQVVSFSVSWELPGTTPEAFVADVRTIMDALLQGGQRADSYRFWCEIGDREYSLELTAEQARLSKEDLLPLVVKVGKW